MFWSKKPSEPAKLDKVIDELLDEMITTSGETEQYTAMTENLVKLSKVKAEGKPERLTPETLALVSGNLLGIMLIVGHERTRVLTSKAIGFVKTLR